MELLSSSDADIARAAAALASGGLVAFPTETVYGLGGDAFSPAALARIFEVKKRPRFDPLIIHIAGLETLDALVNFELLPERARETLRVLSGKLWPGPLTLILPKRPEVPDLATAGLPTAAIRFPSHPVTRRLIRLSTGAVAAPSANLFGRLSPTRAEHVVSQLGDKVDFIIDIEGGGKTDLGVESTVLDISSLGPGGGASGRPRILRPGGCSREEIEALIGPVDFSPSQGADASGAGQPLSRGEQCSQGEILSPGQLKSHYAPRTPLVLYRRGALAGAPPAPGEGRLYFDKSGVFPASGADGGQVRVLSESGSLSEAAANLFDMLHQLDGLGLSLIRAEEAPPEGLGIAINDRLRRAGAKASF
jgi:L-threonylcarbamoyladenylate synthase